MEKRSCYFNVFICDADQCVEENHPFAYLTNAYQFMTKQMKEYGMTDGFIPTFKEVMLAVHTEGKYSHNGDFVLSKVFFEDKEN